jgi:tetratricopeptide (TPR) repeat protein
LLCAALLIAGCATAPSRAVFERQWLSQWPERLVLAQVPFFAQDDTLCGPASLAMVAQAAGSSVTPEALTPLVYLPGRQGSLQVEMLAAARRHGLVPYRLQPSLVALMNEVAAGEPVLVLQNLSLPIAPQWHYAVVVGYDRAAQTVLLHSGTTPRLVMPLATFEHTWARSDRWAVRVTAPSQLPATANADAWAAAVAPMERVNVAAAAEAWRTALMRWPDHRISLLGLGNAVYAQGQLNQAATAYETAVQLHPDFADAWNNLAQVRLDLDDLPGAASAIDRAVALGGSQLSGYQRLQRRIAAGLR